MAEDKTLMPADDKEIAPVGFEKPGGDKKSKGKETEPLKVEVLHGRILCHDDDLYKGGESLNLPKRDAMRLHKAGHVRLL